MSDSGLKSAVREHRERMGLSQQALAEAAGVSRQAIIAIEAGRQVPSTALSLRLARSLRCAVEDLFSLSSGSGLAVRVAPSDGPEARASRVALAEIDGRWVAHRLAPDATLAADGLLTASVSARSGLVEPLTDPAALRRNVLVAGCAPVLGSLVQRVGSLHGDARATWLAAGSSRALDLLADELVQVAGLHRTGEPGTPGAGNEAAIRSRFPDQRMLLINLTRWRQGLVLPQGNPLAIRSASDLVRSGLRLARREEGAGAHELLTRLLAQDGVVEARLRGPLATGHADVARLVSCGAADVGVAIESVALAAGLDFVPLSEERFDLVVPARLAEAAPVSRFLDTLSERAFRAEMAELPGYDAELTGHVTTLEAAA